MSEVLSVIFSSSIQADINIRINGGIVKNVSGYFTLDFPLIALFLDDPDTVHNANSQY